MPYKSDQELPEPIDPPDEDGGDALVQSLARGISVIRTFAPGRDRMTIAQVAAASGLTRAGARRILLTLRSLGYVGLEGRSFFLTARILELGQGFLARPLWEATRAVLDTLAGELNETVSAGLLEGNDVIYVIRVRSSRAVHLELREGARLPAHASSMGRVLLAALPTPAFEAYLRRTTFTPYTKLTVVEPDALRKAIEEIRKQGWCHVRGEIEEGVSGVSVPLIDRRGKLQAALNVSTNSERASAEEIRTRIVPKLRAAAKSIAEMI